MKKIINQRRHTRLLFRLLLSVLLGFSINSCGEKPNDSQSQGQTAEANKKGIALEEGTLYYSFSPTSTDRIALACIGAEEDTVKFKFTLSETSELSSGPGSILSEAFDSLEFVLEVRVDSGLEIKCFDRWEGLEDGQCLDAMQIGTSWISGNSRKAGMKFVVKASEPCTRDQSSFGGGLIVVVEEIFGPLSNSEFKIDSIHAWDAEGEPVSINPGNIVQ